MQRTFTWTKQYVFKSLLLGYLLQLFAVVGLGAHFLALYAQTGSIGWMVAVGVCAFAGSLLVWRYHAELVVIDNDEIVIYRWLSQPIVVSIALNDIQVRQNVLGRLFDSGTLYVELEGKQRKLASIGMLSAFQYVVAERHDVICQLLVARRQRIQAEDREIGALLGHMVPQR
ncbi:MAG TPA: hypothetical protein VGD58_27650 [Herpetosiphonaceae bacterium]